MAGLAKYIQWLWLLSVALQVLVCTVLFLKGNYRRLPIFTAYVLSNICQAAALYLTYEVHGFRTEAAIVIGWSSQGATQVFRVLATTEVIRLLLKPYRGIWGLGWRVLVAAFGVVFSITLIDAGRGLQWTIWRLELLWSLASFWCTIIGFQYIRFTKPFWAASVFIRALPFWRIRSAGFFF
jgi:hypothetical protein